MGSMDKKRIVVLVAIILVILILAYIIIQPKKAGYSKNPEDWIEQKGDVNKVNVEKATGGKGYFNMNNQQYKFLSVDTSFGYDGLYEGEVFKNKHYNEQDKLVIEITQELVPDDGILQGIIIEKFEEGKPVAYIFLDGDWKEQFLDLNIVWGKTYQNIKKFDFNEISPGIYANNVDDDPERFNEDFSMSQGGIIVGNLKEKGEGILGLGNVTVIALH